MAEDLTIRFVGQQGGDFPVASNPQQARQETRDFERGKAPQQSGGQSINPQQTGPKQSDYKELTEALRNLSKLQISQAAKAGTRFVFTRVPQIPGRAASAAGRASTAGRRTGRTASGQFAPVSRGAAAQTGRAGGLGARAGAVIRGVGAAARAHPAIAAGVGVAAVFGSIVAAGVVLTRAFNRQARDLEDLSGPLARVAGIREARMEQARLRRAQAIGGSAASTQAATNRLAEEIFDFKTSVLQLLSVFTPLLEGLVDSVTAGVSTVNLLVTIIRNGFNLQAAEVQKEMAATREAFAEIFRTNEVNHAPMDPAIVEFFGLEDKDNKQDNQMPKGNP